MHEYVEFLGRQSPYDRLDVEDLERLARHVEVEFFAAGATIVHAHGRQLDHLYVVRTGSVHVVDRGRVVDELVPGDTFGHISVLSGLPPPLSVVAVSDTLCYRLPDPRAIVEHGERLTFAHYNTMVSRTRLTGRSIDQSLRPVREFMREPLICRPDTPIREAAAKMSETNQSCVIVESSDGVGIMTDSDCRRLVATGLVSVDAPVSVIATTPARTISETTSASTAFVEMVIHGVHHLIVRSTSGRVVGVTRVFDLSSSEIRDPLIIRSSIDQANNLIQLAEASALLHPTAVELSEAGVPALRTGALLGAIMEAVVEKCISFQPEFDDDSTFEATWFVLGSVARREPLPWSDVDTALAWTQRSHPTPQTARVDRPLLDAAEAVIRDFEKCGLKRCVDGANASNPLFNRSKDDWLAAARNWIAHPEREGALLLSSMVTDSRPITDIALGKSLNDSIDRLSTNKRFLKRMLDETLTRRPPTGFVRDFVVEANGQHRGQLNLKRGGLSPVVAIGRWIAVTTRMPASSTQDRLAQGAASGLLTKDEADTLRGAHREMFELLFTREIEAIRTAHPTSTYIDPEQLDSLTRRHLRESFRAIARVQSRLEAEWISRLR